MLRRALPQNSYWEESAPTSDARVLAERHARQQQRNASLGRIQAGEASEEAIHAYFAEQRRLHEDALEFATTMLREHAAALSEQDIGLFELGANMHRDRLAELPQREKEALARKQVQDERREAWVRAGKPIPSP